jgi:hypothetical protein
MHGAYIVEPGIDFIDILGDGENGFGAADGTFVLERHDQVHHVLQARNRGQRRWWAALPPGDRQAPGPVRHQHMPGDGLEQPGLRQGVDQTVRPSHQKVPLANGQARPPRRWRDSS